MLLGEEGDLLHLSSGAPRAQFLPGKTISVEHAATFFGDTGFQIESHADEGYIQAQVSLPNRDHPREIVLRLRDPQGKKMTRVELNGQSQRQFDCEREVVTIPGDQSKVDVRAYFR